MPHIRRRIARRIREIDEYMRSREDAGGLLDELQELEAELAELNR